MGGQHGATALLAQKVWWRCSGCCSSKTASVGMVGCEQSPPSCCRQAVPKCTCPAPPPPAPYLACLVVWRSYVAEFVRCAQLLDTSDPFGNCFICASTFRAALNDGE